MTRFAIALTASAAFASTAAAVDYDVCASGCDFATIQDGIDGTADGDTLWIAAGTYEESLVVDHHVFLLAQSSSFNTVVVEGGGTQPVLTVTEDDFAQVRRMDFTGGGGTAGIRNHGELRLVKSYIYDMDAEFSAILNLIENTTIPGYQGYLGGGVSNTDGTTTIKTSSLSGNHADSIGGGWSNHNLGGTLDFQSSASMSSNTSGSGQYEDCYDVHGACTP